MRLRIALAHVLVGVSVPLAAFSQSDSATTTTTTAGAGLVSANQIDGASFPREQTRDTPRTNFDSGGGETSRPALIFFPPHPPPLDRPVPYLVVRESALISAPAELAAYVDEPFYGSLGPRLFRADNPNSPSSPLNKRQLTRLQTYTADREAAYQALRAEIERTRSLESEARRTALTDFARRQTPHLAKLEQTAEDMRKDFNVRDWSEFRQWRLGEKARRGDSPREIADVVRAYGHFQNGLSVAQRRLLREVFFELALASDNVEVVARDNFWYFSPEPARITLPDTIAPALAAKFGAYQTRKSELKKELYDAIYAKERSGFWFGNGFQTLAERQAPQFVALEAMAEDIRVDLSRMPSRGRPLEVSPLPPPLTTRIAMWTHTYSLMKLSLLAAIKDVQRAVAGEPIRIEYEFGPSSLKYRVGPTYGRSRRPAPEINQMVEATEQRMAAITASYQKQFDDQRAEVEAIREAARAAMPSANARQIEAAITTPLRMALQAENKDAFLEYYIATLEPGLSIEQRRLLFGRAIEHLDLGLPFGSLQPTYRQDW